MAIIHFPNSARNAKASPRLPSRRTGSLVFSSLILLHLTGCMVGPDYVAPEFDFVAFHNNAAVTARKTGLPPPKLDQWWKGFHDPVLVALVERALDQNLDMEAALARVQQARATAAEAGAQLLPTADLNVQGTLLHQSLETFAGRIGSTFPSYSRDQKPVSIGPAASWEIDLSGGLQRAANAASAEAEAARAEQLGTRISVAADAADAYLQIRGYQTRLSVAQSQVTTNSELVDLVRARLRRGAASEREVAQAEALLHEAEATIPLLRIGIEAQLNRLDVLIGAQPGTYARELAKSAPVPAIPTIPSDARPVDMLRRRPDIMAAERRLARSSERIGAAISDYYPKLSLTGALGFDSLSINKLFTARSFQPIGTGALRWRLFDFGKVNAEVAQAQGANREALALYKQAALKATEDVENAFISLSQTELRTRKLQAEVEALSKARNLSQQSYTLGLIPLTDVLDADRQLLVARDQLASNRTDAARAAVLTFRSLGGGWAS